MDTSNFAAQNLNWLRGNKYPGRGIIIGVNATGDAMIQLYFVTGRSENSRNRIFQDMGGGKVRTAFADPAKGGDPSLVIYTAMEEQDDRYVVSNGNQTDSVMLALRRGDWINMGHALVERAYEPDQPNFTQRITGICSPYSGKIELSILRRNSFGESCDRLQYCYDGAPLGFGYFVSTYSGDGSPLPAFRGDPLLMPMTGSAEEIAQLYWESLSEHRVAIAVKTIPFHGVSKVTIINQYPAVPTAGAA